MKISVDFSEIENWADFYRTFSEGMGFPAFCEMNMNAWVDCKSALRGRQLFN